MTVAWNFERRRVTCAKFIVGVSLLSKGKPSFATTLEAVRARVRLPPEDALFAARRLHDEGSIEFDAGGAVRSTAKGLARADELLGAAKSKTSDFQDVTRTLASGGIPLDMLRLAILANGGALECGAPESDAARLYRLAMVGDEIAVERANAEGMYEAVTEPAAALPG